MKLSQKSIDLIVGFEVGSEKLYTKKYTHPVWPGGESGVTIGIGYDLGYNTADTIKKDWTGFVSNNDLTLMCSVAGLKGAKAKTALTGVKAVTVSFHDAMEVFIKVSVTKFAKTTLNAFPGVQELNPDTQGALVSLVFNRGGAIDNTDRRKEMKEIRNLVPKKDYKGIAAQFRSMKRLWDEKTARGLILRRESEAVLIDNSERDYSNETIIDLT